MHLKPNLRAQRTYTYIQSICRSSWSDFAYRLHYLQSRRQHICLIPLYSLPVFNQRLPMHDMLHVFLGVDYILVGCDVM